MFATRHYCQIFRQDKSYKDFHEATCRGESKKCKAEIHLMKSCKVLTHNTAASKSRSLQIGSRVFVRLTLIMMLITRSQSMKRSVSLCSSCVEFECSLYLWLYPKTFTRLPQKHCKATDKCLQILALKIY